MKVNRIDPYHNISPHKIKKKNSSPQQRKIESISVFSLNGLRKTIQIVWRSLSTRVIKFLNMGGSKKTPIGKTAKKVEFLPNNPFRIHPPGQKPHLSQAAKREVMGLIQGKDIDLEPVKITNADKSESLEIPLQFYKDLPRMDLAIESRAMIDSTDSGNNHTALEDPESLYKCCKELQKKYGPAGLKMLASIMTQALAASITIDVNKIDQAIPSGSKPFWNIRKDRQGHIHIELTLLFTLRDPVEIQVEGYRAVKREIVFLSKKEFSKENPHFNVYEWSSDFFKQETEHSRADIQALRDLKQKHTESL